MKIMHPQTANCPLCLALCLCLWPAPVLVCACFCIPTGWHGDSCNILVHLRCGHAWAKKAKKIFLCGLKNRPKFFV